MSDMEWMPEQEFHESGLLWHVNQAILWPLGLALAVTRNDDGSYVEGLRVLRRVPFEAIWSGATEAEAEAQADRLAAWMRDRLTPR